MTIDDINQDNIFDIVESLFTILDLWHEGQFSEEYEYCCKIGEFFHPGRLWTETKTIKENPYYKEIENDYLNGSRYEFYKLIDNILYMLEKRL